MIWRDDDIVWGSAGLSQLLAVDDLFQKHGAVHTVAIIASTLTPEIAAEIRDRKMSAQLHCWEHDDLTLSPKAVSQLGAAVTKIEDMVGVRPSTLYPPWNRTNIRVEMAALALGLRVSVNKISLEAFIRCGGDCVEDTINFHYWHAPDVALLEDALQLTAVHP